MNTNTNTIAFWFYHCLTGMHTKTVFLQLFQCLNVSETTIAATVSTTHSCSHLSWRLKKWQSACLVWSSACYLLVFFWVVFSTHPNSWPINCILDGWSMLLLMFRGWWTLLQASPSLTPLMLTSIPFSKRRVQSLQPACATTFQFWFIAMQASVVVQVLWLITWHHHFKYRLTRQWHA